jgi:aryl-alcohol dehydrogenase-like predicted oxidoreductase
MVAIVLGTATFNTGYGVSNRNLNLAKENIREILATSQLLGINEFDSAPTYGEAEKYLGEFLNRSLNPQVSSKISKENSNSATTILQSTRQTLNQTGVKKLKNLFLHDPDTLSGIRRSEIIAGLKEVVAQGLVERVGVSVYSLESLLRAKESFPELNVFQVPENICDRRMLYAREMKDLHHLGDRFIVRSIFLQGLLLMPLHEIPKGLEESKKSIRQIQAYSEFLGIAPLDLCLAYAHAIPWADSLVIGAATSLQLSEIVRSNFLLLNGWESRVETLSEELLDPRRWPK